MIDGIRFDSDWSWWQPPVLSASSEDRRCATVADLIITDLAAENALLREHVESLTRDTDVYRQMVRVLLTRVHDLQRVRRV